MTKVCAEVMFTFGATFEPLSERVTVTVAAPFALAAVVYVKFPVAGSIVVLTTPVDAQQPVGQPWDSISRVFGAAANVNADLDGQRDESERQQEEQPQRKLVEPRLNRHARGHRPMHAARIRSAWVATRGERPGS